MKIRITVTVDVDETAWALDYGTDRETVRDDVKSYVATLLSDCRVGSDELWRDVTVK